MSRPRKPVERTCPINSAEAKLYAGLEEQGWQIDRKGWPDFLCVRGEEVFCVEVKSPGKTKLRRANSRQIEVMEVLSRFFPCYVWTPDGGFRPYDDKGAKK